MKCLYKCEVAERATVCPKTQKETVRLSPTHAASLPGARTGGRRQTLRLSNVFAPATVQRQISGRPVIPDKMAFADGAKSILFPNVCYFSHLLHIDIKINYVSLLNN